jgi:biopolymer transport protein ExbB
MLVNVIQQAGPLGKVLVVVSILSLGVIMERGWFWFRKGRTISESARRNWLNLLRKGKSPDAKPISPEGRAVTFLYEHRSEADEKLLDIALSREVRETNRYLSVLDTCAAVAPMLGILGTVLGIIQAFAGMKGDAPDTGVMVSGISVAMTTTAIGLVVALVSLVAFNAYSARAHKRQTETGELLHEAWIALLSGRSQVEPAIAKCTTPDSEKV